MKFRMFDITGPVPFSQGYAIKHLMKTHGGKLLAAGECADHGGESGTLLYVKMQAKNVAELIVLDDGVSLRPRHLRLEGEPWQTHDGEKFQPDPKLVVEAA